jgi:hypothetical protein
MVKLKLVNYRYKHETNVLDRNIVDVLSTDRSCGSSERSENC